MLTPAQLQTLKAAILANPTWAAQPMTHTGAMLIANDLNSLAAPAFTVWKTKVNNVEIGDAMDFTEVAGLTALKLQRLQVMEQYSDGTQNPSKADRRAGFDDVFSGAGGQITRPRLLVLWKRGATVGEKLYATGTGSDASPAALVVEGAIAVSDVEQARELP